MRITIFVIMAFVVLCLNSVLADPAINISDPIIPSGYYTENHTIIAYSRIYKDDASGLRANVSLNTSAETLVTQYISSITSFENNNSNGWTVSNKNGYSTSTQLLSEGNTKYNLASTSWYLSKDNVNLSNYDFIIFDYKSISYKFWLYLNSTPIFTSVNADYGEEVVLNQYVNLSQYGGLHNLKFKGDSRVCTGSCPSTNALIDNIRLGAYFDNGEYNITSNTNVTTLFNLQTGVGVSPQDLMDVDDNFTVVFNVSDSVGNTTSKISNLMNISNRPPSIANVTLTPTTSFENATLLSYAFIDPDDGHSNVSQYCRWYKNSVLVYGGGDCVLDAGNYSGNDILVAEVKASDGYNYSAYVNSTNLTVGDRDAPSVSNISIPSTGYAGNQQTILADCDDAMSPIEYVTINITDSDNQLGTYTMTYYTGNTYRLYYTPGKPGTYYFTGIRCIDSSYNQNVTTFNYSMDVAERAVSGGPAGGGGNTKIITEIIVQKPENESLFLFKTMAGTGATDVLLLPNQVRKITLKLISQHDKELSIRLYCADETVANLCRNIEFSNQTITLKPSAVENVDIQIKAPDEFNYGDTGKFNMVARLVVLDSIGDIIDSKEQKVVRIQETISSWAYPALWAYNQFTFYIPYRGVWIPKAIVFTLAAGFITLLFSLIIRSGLALTGLFFVFYFAASVLEMLLSM